MDVFYNVPNCEIICIIISSFFLIHSVYIEVNKKNRISLLNLDIMFNVYEYSYFRFLSQLN